IVIARVAIAWIVVALRPAFVVSQARIGLGRFISRAGSATKVGTFRSIWIALSLITFAFIVHVLESARPMVVRAIIVVTVTAITMTIAKIVVAIARVVVAG